MFKMCEICYTNIVTAYGVQVSSVETDGYGEPVNVAYQHLQCAMSELIAEGVPAAEFDGIENYDEMVNVLNQIYDTPPRWDDEKIYSAESSL